MIGCTGWVTGQMVNIARVLFGLEKPEKMDFSKDLDKIKTERSLRIPKSEEE